MLAVNPHREIAVAQKDYNPLNDPVYMSPQMKQFFKHKLLEELERIHGTESFYATSIDFDNSQPQADPVDQGTIENLCQTHRAFYKHEKLLSRQIELSLQRLASGNYGYCVVTGEPIGVARLMAAPYTPYCLDAQEDQEHRSHFSALSNTAIYPQKLCINDRIYFG